MSTSESIRGPGRPRAFDEQQVLAAAMHLFWRVGYGRASVPALSQATGLSSSSLYNAYGSKLELFGAALERYRQRVIGGHMLGPLAGGEQGLADLDAFLERLNRALDQRPRRGCLVVNTIAEFRDPPPAVAACTARYRADLRAALRAALARAADRAEIAPDGVDARAEALAGIVIAFNLLVASRAPKAEARALLGVARDLAAA
jgi:AcrR family transcriptional regulator